MIPNRFRAWFASGAGRPLILAHRGDSFHAPENTPEAARLGHSAGADGWELDVRLTLDGVPVVLHDESLTRTTDVARKFEGDPRGESGFPVGAFRLDEVRSLDAGSWFVRPSGGPRSASDFGTLDRIDPAARSHYESGSVRVPTLAEALDLTAWLDWMVNVEIKPAAGDRADIVGAVLDVIRAAGTLDRVAISSFDHEVVRSVAGLEPRVASGALIFEPAGLPPGRLVRGLGADALHAHFESILAGEVEVGAVPILAYTVNETGPSGSAVRLASMGVSGLFTDDPAGLVGRLALSRS